MRQFPYGKRLFLEASWRAADHSSASLVSLYPFGHGAICGTGTEDYFGGAWNFDVPGHGYTPYCSAFLGLHQVLRPDGLYASQQRFGMYRWHGPDPVRFAHSLRVTVQDLGRRSDGRYLPRRDDLASTAWWYQESPGGRGRDSPTLDEMDAGGRQSN